MENVVSIIKSRDNELEFDISIQGVEDEGTQVRFVIDADPAALIFNCAHKGDDKWVVNVPPIPQIEAKSYDFHIEIVVSGYFFTPFKGTINVTNEPEVKSSGVSAPVVAPTVGAIKVNGEATKSEEKEMKAEKPTKAEKKEEKVVVDAEEEEVEKVEDKKEEKKEDDKKTEPLPDEYQDLADQLIKSHKEKKGKETEQGKKVKDVLKSMKKDEKNDEKKDEPKKAEVKKEPKKTEPKKEEKKPEPKKKVKENTPIIPRHSNLTAAIEDWKKPQELSEQAKKVQDILKTLH